MPWDTPNVRLNNKAIPVADSVKYSGIIRLDKQLTAQPRLDEASTTTGHQVSQSLLAPGRIIVTVDAKQAVGVQQSSSLSRVTALGNCI